jgi:hypothetical protein
VTQKNNHDSGPANEKTTSPPSEADSHQPETSDLVEASTGFDLGRFRLRQDFTAMVGIKKVVTTVPVRKPPKQQYIFVRPGDEWRGDFGMVELKEDREFYLVDPTILPELMNECVPYTIVVYAFRGGGVGLWPIRLPGEDGKTNDWWDSARELATDFEAKWIRVVANMTLGAYEGFAAIGNLGEPEWPAYSFGELIELAFEKKNRIIRSVDHIVVRKLRGEV